MVKVFTFCYSELFFICNLTYVGRNFCSKQDMRGFYEDLEVFFREVKNFL